MYRLWDSANSNNNNKNRQVGATRESTLPLIAGLSAEHHQGRRILSLPLWIALQALGKEGVHSRIRDNFLASERLWAAIDVFRHVRVLVCCNFIQKNEWIFMYLFCRVKNLAVRVGITRYQN